MRRPSAAVWRGVAMAVGLVVAFWAIGPLVVLIVLVSVAVPQVRDQVRRRLGVQRPGSKSTSIVVGVLVLIAGAIAVLPDGILPIPPGAGSVVTPGYLGRPAIARPLSLAIPQNPSLAINGTGARHNDTWSSDAYDVPGPLGESPEVDTAWFGLTRCSELSLDGQGRFLARCVTPGGPVLQVIDPDSMRPVASLDLVERPDQTSNRCGAAYYLDARGRAVIGSADRTVLIVETSDGRGEPDLTVETTYDLTDEIPSGDCLVALLPGWTGRIWWATEAGRVGFVDPATGTVRSLDLGEPITNSISIDRAGGVYVATTRALHRVAVDPANRPKTTWSTVYDSGTRQKDGQPAQGSGTTPTLLPGGLVAIADNAEPRMHVQFYRADTGRLVCQTSVFDDDASATESSLTAVGAAGVVVQNSAGDSGRRSTMLGRAPTGGFARVDVVDDACEIIWTNDEIAPRSVSKVSLVTGLLYAVTKRRNLWGVNAWYFTAIDARTGKRIWSVRTGIGLMFDPHGAVVTLGPEGAAYVATMTGLVRVRDRRFS